MEKIINAVILIVGGTALVASIATIIVLHEIRTELRMHDVVSEFSGGTCGVRAVNPVHQGVDRFSSLDSA